MVPDAFKKGIFPLPPTEGTGLNILTLKQIPQRLPLAITLVKAKAGNAFKNLRYEIHQIIYYLYQANELIKKYTTT